MNKEYFSNSTNLININRKKKQDRDLKILRENRQERREEEEEGKRRENKGKKKRLGGNKFKGRFRLFNVYNMLFEP